MAGHDRRARRARRQPGHAGFCSAGCARGRLACALDFGRQWQPTGGTLVNPVSGKCLDDPNFNFTDGTQLQILACDGRGNQQWAIP